MRVNRYVANLVKTWAATRANPPANSPMHPFELPLKIPAKHFPTRSTCRFLNSTGAALNTISAFSNIPSTHLPSTSLFSPHKNSLENEHINLIILQFRSRIA